MSTTLNKEIDLVATLSSSTTCKYLRFVLTLNHYSQLQGVKNICQGFITELETNQSEMRVVEAINRILKLKNTNAPRRPQRIILMGSPGSKKEEYALKIAEKYQVVYVQVSQLIKEVTRRNDDNDYARQLKSYIAQDRIGKWTSKLLVTFEL